MYRSSLGELNDRIAGTRKAIERREQLQRLHQAIAIERGVLEELQFDLIDHIAGTQTALRCLRGFGPAGVWARLCSSDAAGDAQRDLEHAECLRDQTRQRLELLAGEISSNQRELAALGDVDGELRRLLGEKEKWITSLGGPVAEELFALSEEVGRLQALASEIKESLQSGENAQSELVRAIDLYRTAQQQTPSANAPYRRVLEFNRDNLHKVQHQLIHAQAHVSRFKRELLDTDVDVKVDIEVRNTIAPLLVSDVSGPLPSGPSKVMQSALDELTTIMQAVEKRSHDVRARIDEFDKRRADLLDRAGG